MDIVLISPSTKYKPQFLDFYEDFVEPDPDNAGYYSACQDCFGSYVQELRDNALPENESKDHVPYDTYWLVDEHSTIIGVARLRHHIEHPYLSHEGGHIGYDIRPSYRGRGFGKLILSLALEKARELGLRKVLIVADEYNMASRNIIEANGGVIEGLVESTACTERVARYWVTLS